MTIRNYTWTPDTCPAPSCKVVEAHDDATGIFTAAQILNKCSAHSGVTDGELYNVLISASYGENKRPGSLKGYALATFPTQLGEQFLGEDGTLYWDWKTGITVTWAWVNSGRNDRTLSVTVTGASLTNGQKNNIQSFCDTAFGANRVTLTWL